MKSLKQPPKSTKILPTQSKLTTNRQTLPIILPEPTASNEIQFFSYSDFRSRKKQGQKEGINNPEEI